VCAYVLFVCVCVCVCHLGDLGPRSLAGRACVRMCVRERKCVYPSVCLSVRVVRVCMCLCVV